MCFRELYLTIQVLFLAFYIACAMCIALTIAVPAQKILGGNEVLPKFCDVCPNHDFIVHFGYDKKIV